MKKKEREEKRKREEEARKARLQALRKQQQQMLDLDEEGMTYHCIATIELVYSCLNSLYRTSKSRRDPC